MVMLIIVIEDAVLAGVGGMFEEEVLKRVVAEKGESQDHRKQKNRGQWFEGGIRKLWGSEEFKTDQLPGDDRKDEDEDIGN